MVKGSMELVASSEGVSVYCPKEGRFSFFNSPYPAHRSYAGVDVYPKGAFGDVAPSPVWGEVTKMRMIRCPQGKSFEGSNYDYVILLRSLESPERWVKILHVKPLLKVGDILKPGEDIGQFVRSGFFDFWTDPHIHVEVRKPSDPLRARGGCKFERLAKVGNLEVAARDLRGDAVESKPEYSLISLTEKFQWGIPVDLDGHLGLLDAGVPHYGWIGVHTESLPKLGGTVRLCGKKLGVIRSTNSNMCIAECCNPAFTLNGEPVGLSFYIYPSSTPLVKLVPQRPGNLALKRFEEVSLAIS